MCILNNTVTDSSIHHTRFKDEVVRDSQQVINEIKLHVQHHYTFTQEDKLSSSKTLPCSWM